MSRGTLMIGFSESAEYRARSFRQVQVTMLYVSMPRRAPEPGGFDFWVAELAAGGSVLALIGGFLESAEYAARFNPAAMLAPPASAAVGAIAAPPPLEAVQKRLQEAVKSFLETRASGIHLEKIGDIN